MEATADHGIWNGIVSFFRGRPDIVVHNDSIEAMLEPVTKRQMENIRADLKYYTCLAGTEVFNKHYKAMEPDRAYYHMYDFYEALIIRMRKEIDSRGEKGLVYFEDYTPRAEKVYARTPSAASAPCPSPGLHSISSSF